MFNIFFNTFEEYLNIFNHKSKEVVPTGANSFEKDINRIVPVVIQYFRDLILLQKLYDHNNIRNNP